MRIPPIRAKEQIFPYSEFAVVEAWLEQRKSLKGNSTWLGVWMIVCLVAFLLLYTGTFNPFDIFSLSKIIPGASSTAAAAAALKEQRITSLFGTGLVYLGLMSMILLNLKIAMSPQGLAIGKSGVGFVYHFFWISFKRYIPLSELTFIELVSLEGTTSSLDSLLVFHGPKKSLELRIGNITSAKHRDGLMRAIQKYAPDVPRSIEVNELLQSNIDTSYTELWLQALSAPPKRERLKPLIQDCSLNEGRYKVLKTLGSGGQGFAYLAVDNRNKIKVALKESVLPIFVDIETRKKAMADFEAEARLLAHLDHPQIVKMRDHFVEDHRAYLVLELVDGENLRSIVAREGCFQEARLIQLAVQMASILSYIHSLKPPLVHKDFSPDNLLMDSEGRLKLIDFNVARYEESGTTGTVVGKQAYIAPEQFRGQATTASDIYSMGATMQFLLTGADPVPISESSPIEANCQVSQRLDKIIRSMTALEAVVRPAAKDIANALNL